MVGRIAAAVSHVAPAFAVALDVPDVLVPDHVVDPERPRVGLRPGRSLVTKCLSRSGPVVGDHAVEGAALLMVWNHRWAHTAIDSDLRESRPHRSMDLDRIRFEAPLDRSPARRHRALSRLGEVFGGHPADGLVEDDLHPAVLDDTGDAEFGAPRHLRDPPVFVGVASSGCPTRQWRTGSR